MRRHCPHHARALFSHDVKRLGQFETHNQFFRWVRGKRRWEVFRSCWFVRWLRNSDGQQVLPRLRTMCDSHTTMRATPVKRLHVWDTVPRGARGRREALHGEDGMFPLQRVLPPSASAFCAITAVSRGCRPANRDRPLCIRITSTRTARDRHD